MAAGTVKWFNDAKGFGFIEPEGGGADVFAHFSAIQMDGFRTLKQGGRVEYELVQGPKGSLAQTIRPLDAGPAARKAAAESPIAQGLASRIGTEDATAGYRIANADATVVVEAERGDAIVATRSIGSGQVILIGYDYYESNEDADRLVVNAVFWPR